MEKQNLAHLALEVGECSALRLEKEHSVTTVQQSAWSSAWGGGFGQGKNICLIRKPKLDSPEIQPIA